MSKRRVVRGGSFSYVSWYLRTTFRDGFGPESRFRDVGFCIVVVVRGKP